jgi:hypothetical protein
VLTYCINAQVGAVLLYKCAGASDRVCSENSCGASERIFMILNTGDFHELFLPVVFSLFFIFLLSLLAEHRASFQRFLGLEVCIL